MTQSDLNKKADLNRPVADFLAPVETSLQMDLTIGSALESLRQRKIQRQFTYFYVVDHDQKLQGVLSSRKLLLSAPETVLADVMDRPVVSIRDNATLAEAMEEFAIHRLLALPVVDQEGRLLGNIDVQLYAEEAVDLAEANRVADLFQLIGLSVQQVKRGGVWPSFNARMPWLLTNVFSGLICAAVAAIFRPVLESFLILAMFIPVVLTLSESISMQSMTMTLQFLHGQRMPLSRLLTRLKTEWKAALLLGLTCGLLVGTAATFWGAGGVSSAGVIALSICLSMFFAALLGTVVPVGLHVMKLDPKFAAGPVVLMVDDILTTTLYLASGTWMLL